MGWYCGVLIDHDHMFVCVCVLHGDLRTLPVLNAGYLNGSGLPEQAMGWLPLRFGMDKKPTSIGLWGCQPFIESRASLLVLSSPDKGERGGIL